MSQPNALSQNQKRALVRDGFVILKNAVPRDITARAKTLINRDPTKIAHGDEAAINDLFNASSIPAVLEEAMGRHTPPINAQVAVTMPRYSDAVTRHRVTAQTAPVAHVDGGWAGPCPATRSEIEASGGDLHTWGNDGDPRSLGPAGKAPLWQDRERTVAIGSYTALVGVCLNDQSQPGKGQFAVRRGAHEAVEAFFRRQRAAGGPIGGGGPDWPRLVAVGEDAAAAGMMPKAMVDTYPATRFDHPDWSWPELTPVLMREGDAVIALHSLPHTATPNLSDEPRVNVYFRIRRYRDANPFEGDPRVGWGISDHPDRCMNGDFLDYPDGYDAVHTSVDKLCDHWSEWPGLADYVNETRPT